jgi:hypothetical protein
VVMKSHGEDQLPSQSFMKSDTCHFRCS